MLKIRANCLTFKNKVMSLENLKGRTFEDEATQAEVTFTVLSVDGSSLTLQVDKPENLDSGFEIVHVSGEKNLSWLVISLSQ